jgi:hypothetical protein
MTMRLTKTLLTFIIATLSLTQPSAAFGGDAEGSVLVRGNVAYFMTATGFLKILDISREESPLLVGEVNVSGPGGGGFEVAVAGDYAYAAAGEAESDVRVIDISNPAAPVVVRELETENYIYSLTIAGNRLYTGGSLGMQIWELATPSNPQLLGTFSTVSPTPYNPAVREIEVRDNVAYLAVRGFGLMTVDVSNPASPSRIGSYYFGNIWSFWDFQLQGNLGYFLHHNPDAGARLQILDISNPAAPSPVSEATVYLTTQTSIAVSGNVLLISPSMTVFDITDATPRPLPAVANPGGPAKDILAIGNRLYVANPFGLSIYDVQSPTSINLIVPRPTLQIIPEGQSTILRWPDQFSDFKLYTTSDLSQTWSMVIEAPGHEGSNQSYTNNTGGTALFYKLVK